MPEGPNVTDQQFIDVIKKLQLDLGYPPTFQEIADVVGYHVRTVTKRIGYLTEEGRVTNRRQEGEGWGNATTRTIRVVGHDCPHCGGSGYRDVKKRVY